MKNKIPNKTDFLVFGYGLVVILSLVSFRFWRGQQVSVALVLFILAVGCLIVTSLKCESLRIFYDRWMVVTRVIGRVVNTIIFTIIFYVIFGSVGMILRMLRKDLLDISWELRRPSYWKRREDVPRSQQHYQQQF